LFTKIYNSPTIDVSFTAASLPAKLADNRIEDAIKLVDSSKYSGAKLVLKELEGSIAIYNVVAGTPRKRRHN
jgi:hypothetical protein